MYTQVYHRLGMFGSHLGTQVTFRTGAHIYTCTHIHTLTRTHTHTYTHTHTHKHFPLWIGIWFVSLFSLLGSQDESL